MVDIGVIRRDQSNFYRSPVSIFWISSYFNDYNLDKQQYAYGHMVLLMRLVDGRSILFYYHNTTRNIQYLSFSFAANNSSTSGYKN